MASVELTGSGTVGTVAGWHVIEEATPVSVGDAAGSVGSLSFKADATPTSAFAANNNVEFVSASGTWTGKSTSVGLSGLAVNVECAGELGFLNATRTAPPVGNYVETVLEFGSTGSTNGLMNDVSDVAVDSAGNIFVCDRANFRVQKFDATGAYVAQTAYSTSGSADGQFGTLSASYPGPGYIAIDSSDRIYVTDPGNNRVQRFTNGLVYSTKWGSSGSGDGQFTAPWGIAIDSSGNIFVFDYNYRIQKFNSSLSFVLKWGTQGVATNQFGDCWGMACDATGNVYIADIGIPGNRLYQIKKYGTTGTWLDAYAIADLGHFPNAVASPQGVAVDSGGYVFYADSNHITKLNSAMDYVGEWGSYGTGTNGLAGLRGLATDSSGFIYATDRTNNRVIKYDSPDEVRVPLSEVYQTYIDLCDTQSRTLTYAASSDPLVVFPGWTDKVWNKLKQLGAATHTDLSWTGGEIVVADIGSRTLEIPNRTVPTLTPNVQNAARTIELIDNNIQAGDGLIMYTAGTVYSVDVGKAVTVVVSTDNSPLYVNNPTPVDGTVARGQYRVQDSLGANVSSSAWVTAGGRVTAEVVESGIAITFTGPPAPVGAFTGPFSFANGTGASRIPQLSITGSGVTTDRQVFSMRTGAAEDKITREVASAEYSPFLSGAEQMYDRGVWFAVESMAGVDFSCTIPLDSTKSFGEYQGCIIEHDDCKYRVTRAVIGNLGVDLTAKWHTTVGDVDAVWSGLTVGDVDTDWAGFEFGDELIKPLLLP